MTYTVLPNSGQSLGVTRNPINTNFSLIQSVFAENHVGFNNSGAGKHKYVVMPNQGVPSDPPPTTAAGELAIYSKQGSAGVGTSALYMVRDGNAGTEVQLSTSAVGNAVAANTGYTWLPGGLFLQWGQSATASMSNNPVVFLTPFDVLPYSITVTGFRGASTPGSTDAWVVDSSVTVNGFTIYNAGAHTFGFYWMAIGKKV